MSIENATELQPLQNDPEKETEEVVEDVPPEDSGNLVFYIILLHGIGTLMPWNMFINISYDYYETFKMLANATIHPANGAVVGGVATVFSSNFQNYQTIAAQVPNLLLNFINIFVVVQGGLVKRIAVSLIVVAVAVISTMSFIYVDTSTWVPTFFTITILTIIILNGANGIYQNSIFGLASDFPFKYTNAVIIGNNLCGTFVTLLSMATKAFTKNVLDRAFAYFSISLITLAFCFGSFFLLKTKPFFRYYTNKAAKQRSKNAETSEEAGLQKYIATFKEAFPQLINVFLVFFVTLSIFPGIMMYVRDEPKGGQYSFVLPEKYFMDITTFLSFNVFAFIGSLVAGKVQYPAPNRLWIPVYARLLYIPFFAMCNYMPETRTFPVWFPSTWLFIIVGATMSFGSGYFSGLAMMYTPNSVHPSRAQTAGMMAGFFLIFGIVSGLLFTLIVKTIITA
ncbi:unnamed protein product [Caenorhabditis angaria]|uniref:Equilibrative nucleoside transporter 1 n=1 Tax=Caenorhabditis angaria TaxID=860376 RepID=A0A9P1J1H4_9PELO|nr:unnamed protein product [Caenorhabditis angaria]